MDDDKQDYRFDFTVEDIPAKDAEAIMSIIKDMIELYCGSWRGGGGYTVVQEAEDGEE